MRKKLKAFTLAEALIALAIVGVIAVLTLPNVLNGFQKKIYVSNVQKIYSLFSDAARKYMADNRTDSLAETDLVTTDGVREFFRTYFKVVKDCGVVNSGGTDCFAASYKDVGGNGTYTPAYKNRYCVKINTGAVICMEAMGSDDDDSHGLSNVIFDVNGSKAPNIKGLDLFSFEFYSDGKVSEGYDMQTKIHRCDPEIVDGGYASGCFSRLRENNWVMDY